MAHFDGLALINAVTELSELLGRRSTVDEFLQDLSVTVADHLHADVCSVYLYDVEQDVLVLRATTGLNPTLVGKVRLHSGEGLTGYAFLNNSPVLEHHAHRSTLNKPIPDLGEEEYPVFLGVPIKRNSLGIGVLTLQYRADDGIGDQELRTLRSLASHLAAALENAAALYELHEAPPSDAHRAGVFESGLIHGTSASRGIAIGHLEYLDQHLEITQNSSRRSLEEAIEVSSRQLEELQRHVDETLSDVAAMIFSSHLLMLRD
ncbi:MAG TPA: GAF domain-containing protein, partial [Alkalispirochaeta sp.]|nr:GAF domain-containing protein [Alkalispirochaeta sp.]